MANQEASETSSALAMAAEIVTAYAGRNQMAQSELPELIRSAHQTLVGLTETGATSEAPTLEKPVTLVPAVPIDQSVTDDGSFVWKTVKALKRSSGTYAPPMTCRLMNIVRNGACPKTIP